MDNQIQNQGTNKIYIPLQDQSFSNREPNQPQLQPPIIQIIQQPVIRPEPIIINQMIQKPKTIYIDSTNFKTSSCSTICPFCQNQILTRVNKKCNWYSCLLCYLSGPFYWMLLQCCRNKEFNCNDATHTCPRCGNKIVEYTSC